MVGLCRLCASLRKADGLITIFDDNSEICEKLRNCCQLIIRSEDALPKSICQECLEHLNLSHKFYLKVKEAQETLQTLYPSATKENRNHILESHTVTLVKNLSDAEKNRRKRKSSLDIQINAKDHQGSANKKAIVTLKSVKTIKLEHKPDIQDDNCLLSESQSITNSPSKNQDPETPNCLEEVYSMLDMTKEEIILDNSYEVLEALDKVNDVEERIPEEVYSNTKCVEYENDDEIQKKIPNMGHDLVEDDSMGRLKESTKQKNKSLVQNLNELTFEMEYIEDDEYDEVSFSRGDKNKLNDIKAQTVLPPELQFKSWKSYIHLCYLCDLKTSSVLELKIHLTAKHNITQSENIQYKCYDCQKVIPRYNFFLNHIRLKHHPALKLRCDACDLSCLHFEELSHHRKFNCTEAKNYENVLPCNQCFKSLYNTFGLQNHFRSQHTATKLQVTYQCIQCGKHFLNKSSLKTHERGHTDSNTFACNICQKTYTSKFNLDQHVNSHVDDKMYKCNLCDKSFKTCATLEQHQSIHNNEKPFKCEYCEKSFRKKIEKISHERVHTGEMPFQCEECDKRFRFRSAYNAHMKIHTGVRPYSCDYCDKTFAESSNRNKHVRRIHLNGKTKRKN